MKIRHITTILFLALAMVGSAQDQHIRTGVAVRDTTSGAPRIAVPDFPGLIGADNLRAFNTTLWSDLEAVGRLELIAKSLYARATLPPPEDVRFGSDALTTSGKASGLWLGSWSDPPLTARFLLLGQLEALNDRLVLDGYLYDATATERAAPLFGKRYFADLGEQGAREIAHDFSREILQRLGFGTGLGGTRIYFVSDRSGHPEIWSIDPYGQNLNQHTYYNNLTITPTVSADGARLAVTTYVDGAPKIHIHFLESGRRLAFYNSDASLNTTPEFTPDGKFVLFAASITGSSQIYIANRDGRNLSRISYSRSIDVDPVVNPKTGAQIAFVSDRSGTPQVYLMDIDGSNMRRLSFREGSATQPSWDPGGERVALSWARNLEPGHNNIVVINIATQASVSLTDDAGRNESPVFSPSGTHIAFASDRSDGTQIWTMRADGTELKRLTTEGRNRMPVWAAR